MRVLGVIPAREGSKGILNKNIRLVAGKPLISYVIKEALKSRSLNRTIVSTDSRRISYIARKYGAEVPFIRPKKLARDKVSLIPVILHAVRYLEKKEGWKADVVASIQPTSPLLTAAEIDSTVNKLIKTGCDSVISVCKIIHGHPYRAARLEGDRFVPVYKKGYQYLQRQDLPPLYVPNGALFVRRREILEKWNGRDFALGKDIRAIVMNELKSINVDTPFDLIVADAVIKTRKRIRT